MTIEEIVYDILEIKNALEDDHDIDELWVLNKINLYRQAFVKADYETNKEIRPSWVQILPKQNTLKVNSADDPSITLTSIDNLAKITIPKIVNLPGDGGLVRVTGSAGILPYDQIDFDTLMLKITFKEEKMGEFGYCSRVGNTLYAWPYTFELKAWIIAANPMDVQILDSTTKILRDMLVTDEYPVDGDIAQSIILEILTKDLAIKEKSITDIINDSNMQLRVLQSGTNKEQSSE